MNSSDFAKFIGIGGVFCVLSTMNDDNKLKLPLMITLPIIPLSDLQIIKKSYNWVVYNEGIVRALIAAPLFVTLLRTENKIPDGLSKDLFRTSVVALICFVLSVKKHSI